MPAKDFDEFLSMRLYMTSALSMSDMKGLGLQIALDAMHKKHNKDVITGLKRRLQPGRPNWNQVLDSCDVCAVSKTNIFNYSCFIH